MLRSIIPALSCAAALAAAANAQEYQLKTGRRIPADHVKANGDTFTATLAPVGAAAPESLTFGVKDIAQVTMPEPAELSQARSLLANGKAAEAAEALKPALEKTKVLQSVPGSWWPEVALIELDALSVAGKPTAEVFDDATLRKLPTEDGDAVREMIQIAAVAKDAKPETVDAIKSIATHTANSWIQGRAWLQIGNLYANEGKMEQALKAWLRVPVFSGAEKDLALRGTLAAARGMQLMSIPEDGIQLLDDYLTDNPLIAAGTKDLIDNEKKKLTPKEKPNAKATN